MKIFKILIWQRQLWRQQGINIYLIDRQILCQKRNITEANLLWMQTCTIWRIFCGSSDISTSRFVVIDEKISCLKEKITFAAFDCFGWKLLQGSKLCHNTLNTIFKEKGTYCYFKRWHRLVIWLTTDHCSCSAMFYGVWCDYYLLF